MSTPYSDWTGAQDSLTVTVDDHELEMAYRDEGHGDVVVCLHGIPTNSYLFHNQLDAVAEQRRVIAPDMIGYGQSAMHDGFDRSIRAQEIAIRSLLDTLDIGTIDFVGHDLGGGVGLRLAARSPNAVDKLVLSNSVAYDSWPIQTITNLGLPETAREKSVEEIEAMLADLFRETLLGDEYDQRFLEAMKTPWTTQEGITSLVRNASATNTSHTTEVNPSDVTAETLLLWGAQDEFQPIEWAEKLQSDISSAELISLDANHWVPEDRPEQYTTHLTEFLF